MVWRKKKQHVEERDGGHRLPVREHSAAGSGQAGGAPSPSATGLETPSGSPTALIPQNEDAIRGVWQADTREFCMPVAHSVSKRPYVIPRNYRISGNLCTARQVVVQGEFTAGVLEAPTVTVAPMGGVRGRVTADNVQIAGTVDAKVQARTGVEVSGRGRLAGDVRAPALKVWPGAVLHASKLAVGC